MIYLPVTVLLWGEVPWFAEWFIHLSSVAAQARGIPISAPTNALFLPYLAACAEGVGTRGAWCACLLTCRSTLLGLLWVGWSLGMMLEVEGGPMWH